ncbi:helix-turn-helix domain-containing protein [uncultured Pontibacter sp.]|uniref:helix-turn-helix domain-containing protein n=1 Tax=uncultured Pontibacter sp. TaxID=453356 RepID=UPI00260F99C1|nr:helix-turn-helix domain-containing protein [uncultured Pontibacter sp.]
METMQRAVMKNNTHRGEIIREAIKASGVAIGVVADKLGISRKTLYNKFKESSIPFSFILRLGEVIHHDFSQEFPHLSKSVKKEPAMPQSPVHTNLLLPFDGEPIETPKPNNLKECEAELVTLQRKYIALLEKFNELLLKTSAN